MLGVKKAKTRQKIALKLYQTTAFVSTAQEPQRKIDKRKNWFSPKLTLLQTHINFIYLFYFYKLIN